MRNLKDRKPLLPEVKDCESSSKEDKERILSRMLDAHNSVRRRDYAKRRESRSESEIFARQAGETADGTAGDVAAPWQLRQEQIERVPPEYRELVRRYFRALRVLEESGGVANPGGRP